jgi:dihydroorotate dehydrogenase
LGKSKNTALREAVEDYVYSLRALYEHGDYFAINISSPNTPGLRQLQDREGLNDLLSGLMETVASLAQQRKAARKPILVKISPDLTTEALDELLEITVSHGADGLIATNTTISRDGLKTKTEEQGGLSGRPLFAKSIPVIRHIRQQAPQLPIMGVGGIISPGDALEMLNAGANLIQVYTGLIYKGPLFARRLNEGILAAVQRRRLALQRTDPGD